MFSEAVCNELKAIPASNDTIQRRITDATDDVKEQLLYAIRDYK